MSSITSTTDTSTPIVYEDVYKHFKNVDKKMPARQSLWKTTAALPLERQNFLDVLYGAAPLISERNFISAPVAEKFATAMAE